MSVPPPPSPTESFPPPGQTFPPPGQAPTPPGYTGYQQAQNPAERFGTISTFGRRLGGFLLDGLIYGLASLLFLIPGIVLIVGAVASADCGADQFGDTACEGDVPVASLVIGIILLALVFVPYAFYVWQLSRTGQTFGRRLVGVKVIDETTGEPPSLGKAIGRTLFAWIISGQIVYIGYLWMLWDDKQQTLHDKVTSTHVIDV